MSNLKLEAKLRENKGSTNSRRYRRDGYLPSTIYGQGKNIDILIDAKKFAKMSQQITKSTLISLKVDKDDYDVLIQDFQKDYLKDSFIHIDFFELKKGKPVHSKIQVHLIGNPIGLRDGGIIEKHVMEIDVECLPKDIIPFFEVNIEHLNVNQSLHVKDLNVDKKLKLLTDPEEVVVIVSGKASGAEEIEEAADETATVPVAEKAATEE